MCLLTSPEYRSPTVVKLDQEVGQIKNWSFTLVAFLMTQQTTLQPICIRRHIPNLAILFWLNCTPICANIARRELFQAPYIWRSTIIQRRNHMHSWHILNGYFIQRYHINDCGIFFAMLENVWFDMWLAIRLIMLFYYFYCFSLGPDSSICNRDYLSIGWTHTQ